MSQYTPGLRCTANLPSASVAISSIISPASDKIAMVVGTGVGSAHPTNTVQSPGTKDWPTMPVCGEPAALEANGMRNASQRLRRRHGQTATPRIAPATIPKRTNAAIGVMGTFQFSATEREGHSRLTITPLPREDWQVTFVWHYTD